MTALIAALEHYIEGGDEDDELIGYCDACGKAIYADDDWYSLPVTVHGETNAIQWTAHRHCEEARADG